MTSVHLYRDPVIYVNKRVEQCPCGKGEKDFLVWRLGGFAGGGRDVCLGCGDQWHFDDGEMVERPFARGWRAESIRRAESMYEEYGEFDIVQEYWDDYITTSMLGDFWRSYHLKMALNALGSYLSGSR